MDLLLFPVLTGAQGRAALEGEEGGREVSKGAARAVICVFFCASHVPLLVLHFDDWKGTFFFYSLQAFIWGT